MHRYIVYSDVLFSFPEGILAMFQEEALHSYKQLRRQIAQVFTSHPHNTTVWLADSPLAGRPATLLKVSRPRRNIYTASGDDIDYLVEVHIVHEDNLITGGRAATGLLMLPPLAASNGPGDKYFPSETEQLLKFNRGLLAAVYILTRRIQTVFDITDELGESVRNNVQN